MLKPFLIFLGKIISFLSFRLNIGGGSTWPGHLALTLKKNFLKELIKKNPHLKIILVSGTNGKTTTVSLLRHILTKLGYSVFSNQEGANLLNGLASAMIKNANLFGEIKQRIAVFEVDEFSLPLVLEQIKPQAIVILNLFRDQLDRYGEVNTIALRWTKALKKVDKETTVVINGDDPYLYYLAASLKKTKVYLFGLNEKDMLIQTLPHDVDFIFCPRCGKSLVYKKISYSHLGIFSCAFCNFHQEEINRFSECKIDYPLGGIYMKYNTHGVFLLLRKLFNLPIKKINEGLKNFSPHFGRQEAIFYRGKKLFLILSKNPASFNQSLETVKSIIKNKKANFLIILNNRIPDGLDVSWIWDVDFKKIISVSDRIYVSGDRAYDMALRLKYEFIPEEKIVILENLKKAINKAVSFTKKDQLLMILPNYSAMLMVRKLIVGRKFL